MFTCHRCGCKRKQNNKTKFYETYGKRWKILVCLFKYIQQWRAKIDQWISLGLGLWIMFEGFFHFQIVYCEHILVLCQNKEVFVFYNLYSTWICECACVGVLVNGGRERGREGERKRQKERQREVQAWLMFYVGWVNLLSFLFVNSETLGWLKIHLSLRFSLAFQSSPNGLIWRPCPCALLSAHLSNLSAHTRYFNMLFFPLRQ